MVKFLRFLKTTAMGGLLVIIPLSIVLYVTVQLFWGLYAAASELLQSDLARRFDIDITSAALIFGVAAAALIGICFFTGLLVRTRFGNAIGNWFKINIAPRIPMYQALSNLARRFVGEDGHEFQPVEVDLYGSPARVLGFLVERLPDARSAVFVPTAPMATVGNVVIVPDTSLVLMDASVRETAGVITQWGVDCATLYSKTADTKQPERGPV